MKKLLAFTALFCLGMPITTRVPLSPTLQEPAQRAAASPLNCALLVAKKIKDPYRGGDQFISRVADKYAEAGRFDQAIGLTNTLRGVGSKAYQFANIARLYAKARQLDQALELLAQAAQSAKQMDNAYSQAEALTYIAVSYVEMGRDEMAFELMQAITDLDKKAEGLTKISGTHLDAGRKDKALEYLAQALGTTKAIPDSVFIDRWLSRIAVKYVEVGDIREAVRIASAIKEENERDWALVNIVEGYAKAAAYQQALKAVKQIIDKQQRNTALGNIGVCYIMAGERQKGRALLSRAYGIARTFEEDREWALADVAENYAAAGLYEQAEQILKGKPENYGWLYVARDYFEDEHYERAFQLLRKSRLKTCEKEELLSDIAEKYLEKGQNEKAIEVANQTQEACARIDWPVYYRPEILVKIVTAYAEKGLFEETLKITSTIETGSYRVQALAGIASQYARRGDTNHTRAVLLQALQSAQASTYELEKALSLADIAVAYEISGLAPDQDAEKILQDITRAYGQTSQSKSH